MPSDTDLGLPKPGTANPTPTTAERPHVLYTLPPNMVGLEFAAKGFGDDDRTFAMAEVTPKQQDHAAKVANGNPSVLSRELIFASLYKVGNWRPRDDRERLAQWWDAIGSKGRRLVEAAFLKMQSVEEADVENFLASGRPSIG